MRSATASTAEAGPGEDERFPAGNRCHSDRNEANGSNALEKNRNDDEYSPGLTRGGDLGSRGATASGEVEGFIEASSPCRAGFGVYGLGFRV
jgi:hypothetical protein